MHGTKADVCEVLAGGATLTGSTPSQVAPVWLATPAGASFCPKREGIGGQNGNFLQRGGIVGIFIKIKDSLVKKSHIAAV
jgi:hypothetical protein